MALLQARPAANAASSHLLQLGSYRYDIWRVALNEFAHHPLAGIGSRGFGPAYLRQRHSPDTPARAHSFELDALSELGIVGLRCCSLVGLVPVLVPLRLAHARARPCGDGRVRGRGLLARARVGRLDLDGAGLRRAVLPAARGGRRRRRAASRWRARAGASPPRWRPSLVALVLFVPPGSRRG